MTNEELLRAGYTQWEPSPYKDCQTDLFEKCIKDEYGKRYFIHVERWDYTKFPRGIIHYTASVQFQLKDGNTTDIDLLNGWTIEEMEEYYNKLWNTGWFKYYEVFWEHRGEVEGQY